MSPGFGRWFVVALCLLAFVGRLAVGFWLQPLAGRIEPAGLGAAIGLAGLVVSVGVPLWSHVRVSRPRRHPVALAVDARHERFVVPAALFWRGVQAIAASWIGGGFVMVKRVPDGDGVRVAALGDAFPLSVAMLVVTFGAAGLLLFANRPSLVLDRAGLTIRWLGWRQVIKWDDLLPGGPAPPATRGLTSQITLYLRPLVPEAMMPSAHVPVGQLGVSPAFLAATIRHYVEQPERRPSIGKAEELTRLRAAFAG